ncbi:MAG TPA: hypothetical protein VGR26_14920 [Acidimicrobiales bacterium]|nr:hypothetical protein [Acidimicrobiales bacterium]
MMAVDRHEAVRWRVCLSKPPLGRATAQVLAERQRERTGEVVRAYRCPFSVPGRRHWHYGHPPSLESLRTIAAAVRNLDEPRRAG